MGLIQPLLALPDYAVIKSSNTMITIRKTAMREYVERTLAHSSRHCMTRIKSDHLRPLAHVTYIRRKVC